MTDNQLKEAAKKVISNFCLIPIDVEYEFKTYEWNNNVKDYLNITVDVDRFLTDSKYLSDVSNIPECIESSMKYLSVEFDDLFGIDYISNNINVSSRVLNRINNDISERIYDTFNISMQDVESMGVEVQLYFMEDDNILENGYNLTLEVIGNGEETEKLGISCDDVLSIVNDVLSDNKFFDLYLQSYDLEVWYCNT